MADHQERLTRRQRYDRLSAALWNERSTFEAHWRELAEYFLPRRPRFFVSDRNRGDKRNQKIVDSTTTFAARTLQSGLHAGLTSPSRPWMRLTTPDITLSESSAVKSWLHQVTRRMLTVFLKSNLYNALPTLYGDLGVFGTAAVGIMEDDQDLFRAYVYPIGSYALAMDKRGLPSTFCREYEMTVGQLVEQFGYPGGRTTPDWSLFTDYVKTSWTEARHETTVWVVWMVLPNKRSEQRGRTPWPYLSVYFEKSRAGSASGPAQDTDKEKVLRESGFWEFPVLVPRWDVTGEDTYGTSCPGMIALGDAKGLQTLQRKKAQAIEKQINPPLVGPSGLKTQKVSLIPGDITYQDVRESQQGLKAIHEVTSSIAELLQDVEEHQSRIDRAFFADLFLMLSRSDPRGDTTAREIEERHEEKLLALGPVLERTNDELLDPLIDRVFAMMDRGGLVPEAPPELQGVDLRVEYVSLMSQAQKLAGVALNDRFFASVTGLAEMFPEVRHKVDAMQAIDDYGDMIGVTPSLIRSDEDAAELLEAEQRAVQEAQQIEQAKVAGEATRALSQSTLEDDSALRRLVSQGGP